MWTGWKSFQPKTVVKESSEMWGRVAELGVYFPGELHHFLASLEDTAVTEKKPLMI